MTALANLAEDLVWCVNKYEDKPHRLWMALTLVIRDYAAPTDEKYAALELLEKLANKEVQW